MHSPSHPSSVLTQQQIELIRENAFIAEYDKNISPAMLSLVYEQGWFKLLVPQVYGGVEMLLPELVKLEEAISWADGSLGWVVTLCAGAGWFGGFLDPSFARHIFDDEKVCLAGSGAATGTAEIVDEGYKINGKWMHASGAPQATVFTANCTITKDSVAVKDEAGNSKVLSFTFLKDEVNIIPQWKAMGMVATASFPYEVKDVVVPANRSFKIDISALQIDAPLYRYPFLQLAEATLAANISGMAMHFIDLCEVLFESKQKKSGALLASDEHVFTALLRAKEDMKEARTNMYHALELSWEQGVTHEVISGELLHMVSVSSRNLAKTSRQSVNELYPFCGLTAAYSDTELNRVWRDINTAGQHALLVF